MFLKRNREFGRESKSHRRRLVDYRLELCHSGSDGCFEEHPKVGRGLVLIVELNGQQHRIEARSVELLPPLPAGAEFLAAYVNRN